NREALEHQRLVARERLGVDAECLHPARQQRGVVKAGCRGLGPARIGDCGVGARRPVRGPPRVECGTGAPPPGPAPPADAREHGRKSVSRDGRFLRGRGAFPSCGASKAAAKPKPIAAITVMMKSHMVKAPDEAGRTSERPRWGLA